MTPLEYAFEPAFDQELATVQRAVDYYERSMQELLAREDLAHVARYYHVASATSAAQLRFKALFFATRLQPVMAYVGRFATEHGRPPRTLDVGCGYGLETTLLAVAGAAVSGVDFAQAKVDGARQTGALLRGVAGVGAEISYAQGDVTALQERDAYDVIYSSATLHHIEPVSPACRAIAQLLKPGGVFFLSDENGLSPAQQLVVQRAIGWRSPRVLTRQDPSTGRKSVYGNENIRPLFVWRRHLREAGLVALDARYCRFLPPLPLGVAPLLRAERRLRRVPLVRELTAIGFVAAFGRPEAS